jgi:ectoine hydroxylase-related dioxygenase (phytanoyl-CoA dioxygenase family)
MSHQLTAREIKHYRREGYLLAKCVFSAQDLAILDQTIEEITSRALASGNYENILEVEPELIDGKQVVRRIYNPFEQHEAFRALAVDDRLLGRVECLVGPSIQLQHSKLNMKAARVGSPVEWHQDLSYFPHTNPDLVTVLVYLDDASQENGCLQVIPRQHHHYLPSETPEGVFAGMIMVDVHSYGKPLPLEGPAGSAIFMHCLTPHSSLPNRSAKARRTLIFEYRAADAYPIYYGPRVASDEMHTRQLRGQPSRYARFGGPPPLIPVMPENFKSLYQLQQDTRQRLEVDQ